MVPVDSSFITPCFLCPPFSFPCPLATRLYLHVKPMQMEKWKKTRQRGVVIVRSENLKWWNCWWAWKWYQGVKHTHVNTHTIINSAMHARTQHNTRRHAASPSPPEISQAFVSPCTSLNLSAVSKIGASCRSSAFLLSWLSDGFCLCWQVDMQMPHNLPGQMTNGGEGATGAVPSKAATFK